MDVEEKGVHGIAGLNRKLDGKLYFGGEEVVSISGLDGEPVDDIRKAINCI